VMLHFWEDTHCPPSTFSTSMFWEGCVHLQSYSQCGLDTKGGSGPKRASQTHTLSILPRFLDRKPEETTLQDASLWKLQSNHLPQWQLTNKSKELTSQASMVAHTCNPSTHEAEPGGSRVQN
jgi:hypothetical protein